MENFDQYKVTFTLLTPQLGTRPETPGVMDIIGFDKDNEGHALISTEMILGYINGHVQQRLGVSLKENITAVEKIMHTHQNIIKVEPSENANKKYKEPFGKRYDVNVDGRVLVARDVAVSTMIGSKGPGPGLIRHKKIYYEVLPEGTSFSCTIKIKKDFPIGSKELEEIFDLGKTNGLGSLRFTGKVGTFKYQLE